MLCITFGGVVSYGTFEGVAGELCDRHASVFGVVAECVPHGGGDSGVYDAI